MDQIISKNTRVEAFPSLSEDLAALKGETYFEVSDPLSFRAKLLEYSRHQETVHFVDSSFPTEHRQCYLLAAFGVKDLLETDHSRRAFDLLRKFTDRNSGEWIFGFLGYDLKNDVEDLSSKNPDELEFPCLHFTVPLTIIYLEEGKVYIKSAGELPTDVYNQIDSCVPANHSFDPNKIKLISNPDKSGYLEKITVLLEEIQLGNIYEINFCRNLFGKASIDPYSTYLSLNKQSPAPFSAFVKQNDKFLLCASPERFLKKTGNTLISQPIKGTRKRSDDKVEDGKLINELLNDPKERAENVMIVDLVRNDLSHTAERGSVQVTELFGVYTFPHVHQLISTVQSTLGLDHHFLDAIKYCFPMGSMTGAPKLRAMKLIEEHESFRRGLFSGSTGFITPNGNFDFNVVIRSVLYNALTNHVSIPTGSAITAECSPEKEWVECELKAKAILSCIR
ncbi:MAG: anthranilate synthase component I family protein [Vicingaceae bacterium]